MRAPVNQKSNMAARKLHFLHIYFHKYCWDMVYPCQIECFKIEIMDLCTHSAVNKASGEQIFELFEDLVDCCCQADRGNSKSSF